MNKKIVYFLVFASLFVIAGFASAQVRVENPLRGIDTFPKLLEKIAGVVATVVGSLAVLMLIVAGIFFLLSAGAPTMLTRARAALMYAIIGAAVALAASGLVALIEKIIGV